MKTREMIRILFVFVSYLLFMPFSFFITNQSSSVFTFILIGSAVSVFLQFLLLFFTPDKKPEPMSALLNLPISDISCLYYVVQMLFSVLFLVLLYFEKLALDIVLLTDSILFLVALLLMFLPAPKSTDHSPELIEKNPESSTFDDLCQYLVKLAAKSDSPALTDSLIRLEKELERLDPVYCEGFSALENEIGNKCVEVESALSTKNGVKITVLNRELTDLSDKIQERTASAIYVCKGNDFYKTDNTLAEGQIDRILDEFHLETEEEIVKIQKPLEGDIRYLKAIQFADDSYRTLLESYNQSIKDTIQSEKEKELHHLSQIRKQIGHSIYVGCTALLGVMIFLIVFWSVQLVPGGFSYSVNEDGETVTITGYNTMYGTEVTVPTSIHGKQVTIIGQECFMNLKKITSLTIPEGVTEISYQAFKGMSALTSLYLPISLQTIGNYSVYKNESMTVYYAGDQEQWEQVEVNLGMGNSLLKEENILFATSEE
jgi:hypothetical protein